MPLQSPLQSTRASVMSRNVSCASPTWETPLQYQMASPLQYQMASPLQYQMPPQNQMPPQYQMPPQNQMPPQYQMPPHNQMPPPPPYQMARPPLTTSDHRMKGGYWLSEQAAENPPSSIPTAYFTHIFYASILPDERLMLDITPTDRQWMPKFTAALHQRTPQQIAILSIGGRNENEAPKPAESLSCILSKILRNNESRKSFIDRSIIEARKYDFDGLDLDWEFPNNKDDMNSFFSLFSEWKAAIEAESCTSGRPRLLLTAMVYYAVNILLDNIPRAYIVNAINNYVDFICIKGYDYRDSWNSPNATAAHACLHDLSSTLNTSYGISTWITAGLDTRKIVIGMPLYGRAWKLRHPDDNGIGAVAAGPCPGETDIVPYRKILDFKFKAAAQTHYDGNTVSTYSYHEDKWIGYDDRESVEKKVDYVKTNRFGGYFLWGLGHDQGWMLSQAASDAMDH